MEDALRKLQSVVRKLLEDPTASRRPQLRELDSRISSALPKYRDPDFDRQKLYYQTAVLLILVHEAGLIG